MSSWEVAASEEPAPVRRVREEVRDGVVVVVFSATMSTAVALAALVLMKLAG
jgi:hypothetical protein